MGNGSSPISRARKLRREMTSEEKILWQKLRGRKFRGLKFLRQHPIIYDSMNNEPKYFIPDFYCAEKNLIIEVDGKIHDFQKASDNRREEILRDMGFDILRFKNEEISNDLSIVLDRLEQFVVKEST